MFAFAGLFLQIISQQLITIKIFFFFHFLVELFIIFLCVVENYFDEVFKYHFKR